MTKDKHPQISVIVPVYKVEPYLRPCVDSILAQTWTDFELILVDDGSPDNCGAICEEYAARDSRVRVIHRENGGLSAARNSGLEVAAGDYISFVDSDDLIAPDFLSRMMDVMLRENVKLVLCGKQDFRDEETPSSECGIDAPDQARCLTGKELCMERFDPAKNILISAWGKLYHRSLWEGHTFPVGKIHEDQFVVPIIMYEAERTAVLNARLYFYRIREGSITSNITAKHFANFEGMDLVLQFYASQGEKELVKALKRHKEKHLANYNLLAREKGIKDVPAKYKMSTLKALRLVKKYFGYDYYDMRLYKLYPKLIHHSRRLHRLSEILSFRKEQP